MEIPLDYLIMFALGFLAALISAAVTKWAKNRPL